MHKDIYSESFESYFGWDKKALNSNMYVTYFIVYVHYYERMNTNLRFLIIYYYITLHVFFLYFNSSFTHKIMYVCIVYDDRNFHSFI